MHQANPLVLRKPCPAYVLEILYVFCSVIIFDVVYSTSNILYSTFYNHVIETYQIIGFVI